MSARLAGVADDGVFLVVRQPSGLTHAAAFGHVIQDVDHFIRRQMRAIKDRAFAAGEAAVAGFASQEPDGLGFVDKAAGREVTGAAGAISDATWVLATELAQIQRNVIHDRPFHTRGSP